MAYILNGNLFTGESIDLSVNKNGSFWYGDGFFESMKYVNGKILFVEQHWERVVISCSILKMENPFKDIGQFCAYANQLANSTITDSPSKRFKLILWRNTFQGYQPEGTQTEFLWTSFDQPDIYYPLNTNGLKMGIYTENLKSVSKLGNVKSNSSQLYVLATLFTQSKNLDDSILLNSRKNPIETSRSNIWVISDNTLYTPSLNEGCLDGIMRRVLLEICNEEDIHVQQEPITQELLKNAKEVFTSGSIRGVQWVYSIDQTEYSTNDWAVRLSNLLNKKAYSL
jgi:branched-chain amino acid aminotransferase